MTSLRIGVCIYESKHLVKISEFERK